MRIITKLWGWPVPFCCLALSLLYTGAFAQQVPSANARGRVLVIVANRYFEGGISREKALQNAEEASQIAWAYGDSALMVDAGLALGRLLFETQRLPEASAALERVLPVAERNSAAETIHGIHDALGMVHMYRAHYDVALRYLFRALSWRQQQDDPAALSVALHHTGLVFYRLRNYDKALNYFRRALALQASIDHESVSSDLHMDIALCHVQLQYYTDGIASIARGMEACDSVCSLSTQYAAAHAHGLIALAQQDTVSARTYWINALELAKRAGDVHAQSETSILLGNLALDEGHYPQAQLLLTQAETLAVPGAHNQLLVEAYASFMRLYRLQEDYERTTFYQEKSSQYRDSVFDKDIAANLAEAQATFEDEQNRLAIELKDEVIRQQRIQGIFIISGVLLLTIVALVLARRVRRRRALRKILESRVLERTTMLEESLQRWEVERQAKDSALVAKVEVITDSLTSLKKVCQDVLDERPDENTKECVVRMITVIEEMEGSVEQGVREIVR